MAKANEIKYLTAIKTEKPRKKYCRFKKMGIRASHTAEVVLDDVRVPGHCLLGGKEKLDAKLARAREAGHSGEKQPAMSTFETTRPSVGAQALGIARAAYEYALDYAKKRVQGGKPIVEQQAVAMMLGTMAMKLDAARLQIWKAAWLADRKQPEARALGLLAKVNASETAFECCRLAGEILGGASIMHDHPVEKYLRDASSFLHSDGTNQVCLLRASQAIANNAHGSVFGF